jgi:hypothetical protein
MTTMTTRHQAGLDDLLDVLVAAGIFSSFQTGELWDVLNAGVPSALPAVTGPARASGAVDVYQLFRAASRIPHKAAAADDAGLPSFGGTLATILAGTLSTPVEHAIRALGDRFGELYR